MDRDDIPYTGHDVRFFIVAGMILLACAFWFAVHVYTALKHEDATSCLKRLHESDQKIFTCRFDQDGDCSCWAP